jgi:hypothetical protein
MKNRKEITSKRDKESLSDFDCYEKTKKDNDSKDMSTGSWTPSWKRS